MYEKKNDSWLSSFRNLTIVGNVTLMSLKTMVLSIQIHCMSVKTDPK